MSSGLYYLIKLTYEKNSETILHLSTYYKIPYSFGEYQCIQSNQINNFVVVDSCGIPVFLCSSMFNAYLRTSPIRACKRSILF